MKLRILALSVALTTAFLAPAFAEDITAEVNSLSSKLQTKLKSGQRTEQALAPELQALDELAAKHKEEKTEEVAQLWQLRATLYVLILGNEKKGMALLDELEKEFPKSQAAVSVPALRKHVKSLQAKQSVVGKPAPELHFTWSSQDGLTTLSDLKGKVVVLDFWATWCGPCIASFPQIRELAAEFAGADVVFLGVTSIQGRVSNLEAQPIDTRGDPKKEMELMPSFIKAKAMSWPVVFAKESVFNPDFGVTGIPHMAIIGPDGTVRVNGIHPAMAHDQAKETIHALLKEFKLKGPANSKS